jgi:hypothetical protein
LHDSINLGDTAATTREELKNNTRNRQKALKYESNLENIIATEIEQHAEEAITDYAKRRLLRSQVRFQNADK